MEMTVDSRVALWALWRSTTQTPTAGGQDRLFLHPCSLFRPTPPTQEWWRERFTSVDTTKERVSVTSNSSFLCFQISLLLCYSLMLMGSACPICFCRNMEQCFLFALKLGLKLSTPWKVEVGRSILTCFFSWLQVDMRSLQRRFWDWTLQTMCGRWWRDEQPCTTAMTSVWLQTLTLETSWHHNP